MNYIHSYSPIFSYFDFQLSYPDWKQMNVLDFGGNIGNFLNDPNCKLPARNYTCLDVDQAPLEMGRKVFPEARWIYYNRFNAVYNGQGLYREPLPVFEKKFDAILAFSVFTHTPEAEMLFTVIKELFPLISSGGLLAFTFIEPTYLEKFIARREQEYTNVNKEQLLGSSKNLERFYYLNHDQISTSAPPENQLYRHLVSFYSQDYMRNLFKQYNPEIRTPALNEVQSCVVFRK
jgi:2-polyprenyl-3-methyl-5-hydroxy-6-metoxy-1,4-benzoquinol methylase